MLRHYSVNLAWSDEDQAYIATSAEFPGLSGISENPDEALAELREALAMAIDTFEEEGLDLPDPRRVPDHSGQLRLRLPKSLHGRIAAEAEREGVSLNTLAVTFIGEGLGAAEVERRAAAELRQVCAELTGEVQHLAHHVGTAEAYGTSSEKGPYLFRQTATGPFQRTPTH